jgi:hypothetical protein
MANQVRKANYCYVKVPNRAGQGAAVLEALADAGVNLIAYSGFPVGGGTAQLDFVVDDVGAIRRLAKRQGWRVSPAKKCFVIRGDDKIGAVQRQIAKLARAGINVTAADAVTSGNRRYGMLLWVKPKDYGRAARTLGAR